MDKPSTLSEVKVSVTFDAKNLDQDQGTLTSMTSINGNIYKHINGHCRKHQKYMSMSRWLLTLTILKGLSAVEV